MSELSVACCARCVEKYGIVADPKQPCRECLHYAIRFPWKLGCESRDADLPPGSDVGASVDELAALLFEIKNETRNPMSNKIMADGRWYLDSKLRCKQCVIRLGGLNSDGDCCPRIVHCKCGDIYFSPEYSPACVAIVEKEEVNGE